MMEEKQIAHPSEKWYAYASRTAKKSANAHAAKITFNYSLLRKAIVLAGGIPRVSAAAGMKPDALRRSLKNNREFTIQEMNELCAVLHISSKHIPKYFYKKA